MEKYLMYLRKSQMDRDFEDASVEETLKRHKRILTEFAERQRLVIAEVLEEVVSGESLAGRPQMLKCLDLVNTGEYAGIVCMDIDRLSRGSSLDSGYIMQVLQLNHCKIVTPSKTYDLDNDSDEQFTDMKFLFSRYELKTIRNRLQRGRDQSAAEGKYLGAHPPYGYDVYKLPGIKGNSLRPNPQEVPVIKLIFNLYTNEKKGYTAIAEHLNNAGILNKGKAWTPPTIQKIIRNPVYIGKIRWKNHISTKRIVNGSVETGIRTNPEAKVYDGLHEAIISEEQFAVASEIRNTRAIPSQHSSQELANPFAGLLYCGNCGKTIARHVYSKATKVYPPKYICRTKGCGASSLCQDVENIVLVQMREWLNGYIVSLDQRNQNPAAELEEIRDGISQQLSDLQAQQTKICDLLEKGIYSVELFTKRNAALESDILRLNESLAAISEKIEAQEAADNDVGTIIPTAQQLLDNYENLTIKEKNNLWKAVLYKIEYFKATPEDDCRIVIYPKLPKL